jgi:asparagine synthase (glutamine-hydrolysing)
MIKCLAVNEGKEKFPWVCSDQVSFKGYVYFYGELKSNEDALFLFKEVIDWPSFTNLLSSLNGFFSVIIEGESFVYAAVDRVTSTPLMYKVDADIWIGDNYNFFLKPKAILEDQSLEQYLSSGYVYGKKTLIKGVFQLLPGTALFYNKKDQSVKVEHYYEYLPDLSEAEANKKNNHLEALDEVHNIVFGRLVKNLNGRKAILPLSGGYDSRLILEMLLRFDYKNILCVTWGRESDWQAKIAKDVASKLGVKWLCVNQDPESWGKWYDEYRLEEQLNYCGALCSIPYLQENILIEYLESKGLIDDDSVFLNGNSGDFIEGDHIPVDLCENPGNDEIINFIKNKHSRLAKLTSYENINRYLLEQVEEFRARNLDVRLFFEYWEWTERQSKFVTKCIKPFEIKGYEWRMPFWENEIMDFWVNIPLEAKRKRALYYSYFDKYMNTTVLKPNGSVSFARVMYERIGDQRFGIFFKQLFGPSRLSGSTSKRYKNFFSDHNVIESESLLTVKLNSLIALDVVEKISKNISRS